MMNTFSLLPINTAHPPLVGKTARTCTSITVLFTSERYPQGNEKQAACIAYVAFISCDTWEHMSRMRFLDLLACMLGALNHCAFCGIHPPRALAK
jgi:hypothetical protein